MVFWNNVFVMVVMCHGIFAATVSPPPIIQTLNTASSADDIGPKFKTYPEQERKGVVEDAKYWDEIGRAQLQKIIDSAKKRKEGAYSRKAKNIIIFVGDGMGLTTITAGRIFKGQFLNKSRGEEEQLSFDAFPYTGLAKTYNVDAQVPDSAGTATALFSGIKTDYGAIGMDITRSISDASKGRLTSIMDWAQADGKRTGIVTTTRITHATPAATFAKIFHRDWECDTKVPANADDKYGDIARQLVENAPGNRLNVIMGGGLSPMGALDRSEIMTQKFEGSQENVCQRADGRNLVEEWLAMDHTQSNTSKNSSLVIRQFVQNRDQLSNVNVKEIDYLMGLFRNNHFQYVISKEEAEPTLKEMVEAAIGVLDRGNDSNGFVLMVEGGRIDQAHHQNYANAAMREVLEFDLAVQAALDLTNEEETLIIVTADHSHALTLNGYPKRGADILRFANKNPHEMVYETLSYANGPGYFDHLANGTNSSTVWLPLEHFSVEQLNAPTYRHMAMMPLKDESHGGEDVIVFANGPGSSLIRGVFEQSYVAYVMSYAGCMGPVSAIDDTCKLQARTSGASSLAPLSAIVLGIVVLLVKS